MKEKYRFKSIKTCRKGTLRMQRTDGSAGEGVRNNNRMETM